jgi:hypothetical protein
MKLLRTTALTAALMTAAARHFIVRLREYFLSSLAKAFRGQA